MESYRLLIDNSNILLSTEPTAARTASAENVERMLQAALYGVQALESATTRAAAAEVHQTEPERVSEDGESNAQNARQVCAVPFGDDQQQLIAWNASGLDGTASGRGPDVFRMQCDFHTRMAERTNGSVELQWIFFSLHRLTLSVCIRSSYTL